MGAGERVAGSPFGVDRVGLRPAAAGRSQRPVQLHDQLTGLGQAGPVTTGALQRLRPHP